MEFDLICNSLRVGGAERQASYLMQRFSVKKLMLIENDVELEAKADFRIVLSELTQGCPSWVKVAFIPLFLFRIWPFRKELIGNPVVSFNTRPNILNVLMKIIWGSRAIISERMNPVQSWKGGLKPFQRWLSAIMYRFSDVIIVNSHGIKAALASSLYLKKEKIRVVYNAIDKIRIQEQMQEKLTDEEEKLFLFPIVVSVGRQRKAKGQWHLIRSFSEIVKRVPDAKLVIIGGSGEVEQAQKNIVHEMGLNNVVFFLGEKANPFKYISRANIFAMSSLHEGLPNVILEAMACRCPVMAADCKFGPREILGGGSDYSSKITRPLYEEYGILMPGFDDKIRGGREPLTTDELLWAEELIKNLVDSRKIEEYKAKSDKRVSDFSIEKIMLEWETIIRKISK